MVLCIIGLVVFSILGIFSAKYRRLAAESLRCVFRMAMFRPCESTLDQRAKAVLTSKAMSFSPSLGRLIYGHFALLSWAFILIFLASTAAMAWGIYNYAAFGNCNGEQSTGFCPFSEITGGEKISISAVSLDNRPVRGNLSAQINIIEFACLQCPYSKQAQPALTKVLDTYPDKVKLTFIFFPLPQHNNGQLAAQAGLCAHSQGKFWEFHDALFENQHMINNTVSDEQATKNIKLLAANAGINKTAFDKCLDSGEMKLKVKEDYETAVKLGLKGTPTFFIKGKKLVGPQPFEAFRKEIE